MTKKLNKKLLISILVFIFLILISAYIIEYNLGYEPCNLCIYERIPYFFSILLISKIPTYSFKKIVAIKAILINSFFFDTTIGMIITSGGIGKKELSIKASMARIGFAYL